MDAADDAVIMQFQQNQLWGLSTAIDVHGCNPAYLRDPRTIKRFVSQLCDLLDIQRFGETVVIRLGSAPQVPGYSFLQFLDSSLISGHFADANAAAYLDIFSCHPYPPYKLAALCQSFLEASDLHVSVSFRHQAQPAGTSSLGRHAGPRERAVGRALYVQAQLD